MAFISFQPSDHYSTKLYTGTGSDNLNITGVGFQPDLTWLKNRDVTDGHVVYDAVRGATQGIWTNNTDAQAVYSGLKSFDSDGYTLGTYYDFNTSGEKMMSYNWKAGTTSGLSGGTITPSAYSINTTAGFGIYKYDGNGTAGATIAHGLGAAPEVVWCKKTSGSGSWSNGWLDGMTFSKYITLNNDDEAFASSGYWNNTAPDATNITLGNGHTNTSGVTQIMYAWTPIKGYSAMGFYEGNNNADGSFIYTGFRPAWVIIKNYPSDGDTWGVWNDKALGYNPDNNSLHPNSTAVEGTGDYIDLLSNGFKLRNVAPAVNEAQYYIYMAFAEFPIVSSNSNAGVAR